MIPFLKFIVIQGYNGKQRTLEFHPGVNIITGIGSKGKSAIVRIIEYCLGSPHCRIPVGKVRDFATWYFLILNVHGRRVIIGRRAPAATSQVSNDAFFDDSPNASIPPSPEANTSIAFACKKLGEHLRFPREAFRLDTDELVYGRVEVRDLLPFLLQPQDIIATQTLFIPIPTDRKLEKDRWGEIVKIALQIISPELLALRAERSRLVKQKENLEHRQRQSEKTVMEALNRIQALWQRASNAGLLPDKRVNTLEDARAALQQLENASASALDPPLETSSDEVLSQLEAQSQDARRAIQRIKADLKQIARIRTVSQDMSQSLEMQWARLRVVDLLGTPTQDEHPCPLCGVKLGSEAESALDDLRDSLNEDLTYVRSIPPELGAAEDKLGRELADEKAKLKMAEDRLQDLQRHEIAPTLTAERIERERIIGALSQELRWAPSSPSVDSTVELRRLQEDINTTDARIRSMTQEKDETDIRASLRDRLTAMAGEFSRLDLHGGELAFDRSFSTIERIAGNDRESLSVLGGAENFVMYHICAFLALHAQLIKCGSFVPPFLVLDQPSQTHFPADSDKAGTDRKAVRAIYDLLFRVAAEPESPLQILVLDHADFSGEDKRFLNARLYDWHGDEGLIELNE